MSRYIAHKIEVDTSGEKLGDAEITGVYLSEANEVIHCREGEERDFIRAVEDLFDGLDDGEALVLQQIVI